MAFKGYKFLLMAKKYLPAKVEQLFLGLAFLFLIADRLRILYKFSTRWIDDDQALLWFATTEMGQGFFREPRFYGQDYSSLFESFLALPFYWLNIPLNIALPVVTMCIAITPFLLYSFVLCKKRNFLAAGLVLLVPLFASFEYGMITSMPRGFMPGIFAAGISWFLIYDKVTGWPNAFFFGFLAVIGMSLNPNAGLISIPLIVFFLVRHFRTKNCLFSFCVGGGISGVIHLSSYLFYKINRDYKVHVPLSLEFSIRSFSRSMKNIEYSIGQVLPFSMSAVLAFLMFGLFIAFLFRNKKWPELFSSITFLCLVFLSFFIPKINDGYGGVYQPLSRMYLGIPVFLAVCIFWSSEYLKTKKSVTFLILLTAVCTFAVREKDLGSQVEKISNAKESQVQATKISTFERECALIDKLATQEEVELIVFSRWRHSVMLNYACGAVLRQKIKTIYPQFERRTWRFEEEFGLNRTKALFWDFPTLSSPDKVSSIRSIRLLSKVPRIHLVDFEPMSILELCLRMKLRLRPYRPLREIKKAIRTETGDR